MPFWRCEWGRIHLDDLIQVWVRRGIELCVLCTDLKRGRLNGATFTPISCLKRVTAVKCEKWGRNFTMQPPRASMHDLVLGRRLVVVPYNAHQPEAIADRQIAQRRRDAHTFQCVHHIATQLPPHCEDSSKSFSLACDAQAATLSAHRVANPRGWPL